jgi:hypothetical protein
MLPILQRMNDPRVPLTFLDDDEIRRLQRVQRRASGAAFLGTGILLLLFFIAGLLFLVWLWRAVDGSPTIS